MTHDIIQRAQLALEEADTSGDLSYQEIARIVLTASGIAELTEALREANDHLKAVVGGPTPYDALLAKIGGNND